MEFRTVFWIPVLMIIAVSIVLYVRLLYVVILRRNTKYFSFFFKMTISQGIIDIVCVIWYFGGEMIYMDEILGPEFLLSINGSVIPKLLYYHTHYFLHAQVFGIVLLSINRYFVVCHAHSPFTGMFDRVPQWFLCLIHIALPLLAILHMPLMQPEIYFYIDDDGDISRYVELEAVNMNALQSMILTTVSCIISSACYIAVLRTLAELRSATGRWNSIYRRRDFALTIVCFALFVVLCIMTAYYLALFTQSAENKRRSVRTIRKLYPYCVLLISFINPWMLLLTNKSTRERIFFKRSASSMTTPTGGAVSIAILSSKH